MISLLIIFHKLKKSFTCSLITRLLCTIYIFFLNFEKENYFSNEVSQPISQPNLFIYLFGEVILLDKITVIVSISALIVPNESCFLICSIRKFVCIHSCLLHKEIRHILCRCNSIRRVVNSFFRSSISI